MHQGGGPSERHADQRHDGAVSGARRHDGEAGFDKATWKRQCHEKLSLDLLAAQ